jgi:mRNA guanylyltransferase
LVLKFPPSETHPTEPDYCAKPIFALHVWTGGEGANAKYEPYDVMQIEDDEWEKYVIFIPAAF